MLYLGTLKVRIRSWFKYSLLQRSTSAEGDSGQPDSIPNQSGVLLLVNSLGVSERMGASQSTSRTRQINGGLAAMTS
jgi:hypothetical protein